MRVLPMKAPSSSPSTAAVACRESCQCKIQFSAYMISHDVSLLPQEVTRSFMPLNSQCQTPKVTATLHTLGPQAA